MTMQVLHVTDIHYDAHYLAGSPNNCQLGFTGMGCCQKVSIPKDPYEAAGVYGDYNCDSPAQLIDESFAWMGENLDPDMVIYTGDDYTHHDLTQTMRGDLDAIQYVTSLFEMYFPDVPVYNTLGNHAGYPVDQLSNLDKFSSWLLHPVADMWKQWLSDDAYDMFRNCGYYSEDMDEDGYTLVSLNSLFYDKNNHFDEWPDACPQWDWLNETLLDAYEHDKNVWLIGHIYPGNGQATGEFVGVMQSMISQYPGMIKSYFWGHSHKDELTFLRDLDGVVKGINYVAPSLVPSKTNPSIRVYHVEDMEVVDFDQYRLNLTQANECGRVSYELAYSAADEYGVDKLGILQWQDIVDRMAHNDSLFDVWWNNYYAGADHSSCTGSCQTSHISKIKQN